MRVDGRVGVTGPVPIDDLMRLGAPLTDGRSAVALVDVLALVRLAASAEVMLMRGPGATSVAIPIRAAVAQHNVRIVLDPTADRAQVLLDAPDWTGGSAPLAIARMSALTFAEFVTRP